MLLGTLIVLLVLCVPMRAISSSLNVAVSIAPQRFVVKGIGGDMVRVLVLVPPNAEPHSYEPTPRQINLLSKATIYFSEGIGMESSWLGRFKSVNPKLAVVPMDAGVRRIPLPHGGYDPHVWISTGNMKIMATNVLKALVGVAPSHAPEFRRNYGAFLEKVDEVKHRLKDMLAVCRSRAFVAFHPAWGYFAREFGFKQIPIEIEGREPTPLELASLVQEAKKAGVKVVLVEPQYSSRIAQVVAEEIGARVVKIDPLAEDWDRAMLGLGKVLREQCQ